MVNTTQLIKEAQSGNSKAEATLLRYIQEQYAWVPRQYQGRNIVVDDAEVESQFMVGVWKGIHQAKLNLGDPLQYCIRRGRWSCQYVITKSLAREIRYLCESCGKQGAFRRTTRCPRCSSPSVSTNMIADTLDGHDVVRSADTAWQIAVHGICIEEMRQRLTGRVLQLFDLIVMEGYDHDSCTNYLKEIAELWGISGPAVAVYLRILRQKVLEYTAESI